MSNDRYETRVRFYANVPRRTHRVMCGDKVIGHVWSNGYIEIDEPTTPAHQHPRMTDAP